MKKVLLFTAFLFCILSYAYPEESYEFPNNISYIVNGKQSTEVYGWMAALTDAKAGQFCGATLIDKDWILTAGHCVTELPKIQVDPMNIVVVLGTNNYTKGGESIKITQAIVHEKYVNSFSDKFNDIALLKLEHSATTKPVSLVALSELERLGASGTIVKVAGWGFFQDGGPDFPLDLYETELPVVSLAECQGAYQTQVNETNICTGIVDGKDSCQGDSGGPIFLNDNGVYKQLGIVSWGEGCAKEGSYGVNTNIAKFIDWINEKTGDIIETDLPTSGNKLCSDIYFCLDNCQPNDEKCIKSCRREGTLDAQKDFDPLTQCMSSKCSGVAEAEFSKCVSDNCIEFINKCLGIESKDDETAETEIKSDADAVTPQKDSDNTASTSDTDTSVTPAPSGSSGGCSILII